MTSVISNRTLKTEYAFLIQFDIFKSLLPNKPAIFVAAPYASGYILPPGAKDVSKLFLNGTSPAKWLMLLRCLLPLCGIQVTIFTSHPFPNGIPTVNLFGVSKLKPTREPNFKNDIGTFKPIVAENFSQAKNIIPKTNVIFPLEWKFDETGIYAFGPAHVEPCCTSIMKYTGEIGIYVWCKDVSNAKLLKWFKGVSGVYESSLNLKLIRDMFSGLDDHPTDIWKPYFIKTVNFQQTRDLYYGLIPNTFNYMIPSMWNLSTFLQIQAIEQFGKETYINATWLQDDLQNLNDRPPPELEVISFDIETVAKSKQRVPLGDDLSDIIFSVSIYIDSEKRTITLLNMPNDADKVKSEGERELYVFNSERALLSKLFSCLSISRIYFLLGYNSHNYDIRYLIKRAAFLNMAEIKYFRYTGNSLNYGFNCFHLDLHLLMAKLREGELESMKLNSVALHCLGKEKYELDAVNLRYIFNEIIRNGIEAFDNNILEYNDVDTLLVHELWLLHKADLFSISKFDNLPLCEIQFQSKTVQIGNSIIMSSLRDYGFLLTATPSHLVVLHAKGIFTMHITEAVATEKPKTGEEYGGFAGGLNYCSGVGVAKNCMVGDFLVYYPNIMSWFVSPDGVTIMMGKYIKLLLNGDRYSFKLYDSHKYKDGTNKTNNDAITELFIAGYYTNDFIKFEDLKINSRYVVIDNESKRAFGTIIKNLNDKRGRIKDVLKQVKNYNTALVDLIGQKECDMIDQDDDEYYDEDQIILDRENLIKNLEEIPQSEHQFYFKYNFPEITLLNDFGIDDLKYILTLIGGENSRFSGAYRNLKILNNSIYGQAGSAFPNSVSNRFVSATCTFVGREYLLKSMNEALRFGGKINYADTDSISIPDSDPKIINHVVTFLSNISPNLELNPKLYNMYFSMAKKVYIALVSGEVITRGINKNGPLLWKETLESFYTRFICNGATLSLNEIFNVFKDLFAHTYELLKQKPELIICTTDIMASSDDYKSETAAKHLMERIQREYPGYTFDRKIKYFYAIGKTINSVVMKMDFELNTTTIQELNLYKFYTKISKALCEMLVYANRKYNYEKYKIHYAEENSKSSDFMKATFRSAAIAAHQEFSLKNLKNLVAQKRLGDVCEEIIPNKIIKK